MDTKAALSLSSEASATKANGSTKRRLLTT